MMDPFTLSAATLALAMIDDLWGLLGERCDLWEGAPKGQSLLLVHDVATAHLAEGDHFERCKRKVARVTEIEFGRPNANWGVDGQRWHKLVEPLDVRIVEMSDAEESYFDKDGLEYYQTVWFGEPLDKAATIQTARGPQQVALPDQVGVRVLGYKWQTDASDHTLPTAKT